MGNLDIKFYLSIFVRRLPYFLVIAAFLSAVGIAVASILPPSYRSTASILVESQQIPGDLAQSTVPIDPIEQIQIIEQRLMTRANILTLASRFDIYADQPDIAANALVEDMRARTLYTPADVGRGPGAIIFEISFSSDDPREAAEITNELVTLVLQENVSIRTDRAGDTLAFFENESKRLSGELDRLSNQIMRFKSQNAGALPESLAFHHSQQALNQERLLQLEREATALQDSRERVVRIYESTGRLTAAGEPGTQEERDLDALRRQLMEAQVIYSAENPKVRLLENRIVALERIVEEQQALEGAELEGMSELDLALAETDGRLEFIAEERARIEAEQVELDASIKATPANELALGALQRDYANTQRQYDETVTSLSQAAIGERIEVLSKGERFTLIEPAIAPAAPEQPNRVLIAGAGVAGGIGAGLGFVVLLELLNRSIRRPAELTSQLGIQPFATIPYIRTRREMRWKRSILMGTLFLIAVAIPAGLFAVHTWYLPLDLLIRQLLAATGLGAALGLAL